MFLFSSLLIINLQIYLLLFNILKTWSSSCSVLCCLSVPILPRVLHRFCFFFSAYNQVSKVHYSLLFPKSAHTLTINSHRNINCQTTSTHPQNGRDFNCDTWVCFFCSLILYTLQWILMLVDRMRLTKERRRCSVLLFFFSLMNTYRQITSANSGWSMDVYSSATQWPQWPIEAIETSTVFIRVIQHYCRQSVVYQNSSGYHQTDISSTVQFIHSSHRQLQLICSILYLAYTQLRDHQQFNNVLYYYVYTVLYKGSTQFILI